MLRFLDNAGIGALTAAGEWYHDRQSHTLYMVGNGTHPPPSEAVASQGTTVLRQVSVCVRERQYSTNQKCCLLVIVLPSMVLQGQNPDYHTRRENTGD